MMAIYAGASPGATNQSEVSRSSVEKSVRWVATATRDDLLFEDFKVVDAGCPRRAPRSLGPDLPYDSLGEAVLGAAIQVARACTSNEVLAVGLLIGLYRCGTVGTRAAFWRAGVDSTAVQLMSGHHTPRGI